MFKNSAFRFLTSHSASAHDDLKGLLTTPNESHPLEVNDELLAFPISGSGGRVGIWPVKKTGRLPLVIPCVLGSSDVTDFKLDPFKREIVLGCDDGYVRFFDLPLVLEGDVSPRFTLNAHGSKVGLLLYHPTANDVLLSASFDRGVASIKVWDVSRMNCLSTITLSDQVLSMAISPDGRQGAAITRDKSIHIFDLVSGNILSSGLSHEGAKAARLVWSDKLLSVGFGRGSQRELFIYNLDDLSKPLITVIDTSPSILLPHYDPDTGLLVLTSKGETQVIFYDLKFDSKPTFLSRSSPSNNPHLAIAFLSKLQCNVKKVEILKGYRLLQNAIEAIEFTVPRVQTEFFQDDIYVQTRDYSKPVWNSSSDWFKNTNAQPLVYVNLKPKDMIPLSLAPKRVESVRRDHVQQVSEDEKIKQSMKAMFELAQEATGKIPENVQGVADDEWDD